MHVFSPCFVFTTMVLSLVRHICYRKWLISIYLYRKMSLRFRKVDPRAVAPVRAHVTDAGSDVWVIEKLQDDGVIWVSSIRDTVVTLTWCYTNSAQMLPTWSCHARSHNYLLFPCWTRILWKWRNWTLLNVEVVVSVVPIQTRKEIRWTPTANPLLIHSASRCLIAKRLHKLK